jgi:hypothetical protein
MTEQVNDKDGKCVAYIEYSLVNDKGILDDAGTYIFIRRLWIWSGLGSGYKTIKYFIKTICEQFPKASVGYWKNREFNGSVRLYERTKIYGSREAAK